MAGSTRLSGENGWVKADHHLGWSVAIDQDVIPVVSHDSRYGRRLTLSSIAASAWSGGSLGDGHAAHGAVGPAETGQNFVAAATNLG
jgi:hypothetical protein